MSRISESPDLTVSTAAQALLAENIENPEETVVPDDADLDDEVAADEDDSEAEESWDDDDLEEEVEAPQTFTVKVGGEEVAVTLDELQKGYSRHQDYTRKTQELAEQRKQIEAEVQAARAERERYAQNLMQLQQLQQMQQQKEPDWDALYKQDPIEWVRQRELWRERKERQQQLAQEQHRVQLVQQQEQAQQLSQLVQENQKRLLEKLPEWANPEVGAKERQQLREFLLSNEFTEAEVSQVYDHRAVVLARDAMRYRQLMQKRQGLSQAKPKAKTATPGTSTTVAESQGKGRKRQLQRLAQTGRVADAAAAIESLL